MRDPKRIDPTLEALARAWRAHPDWRLGQLVLNAGLDAGYDAFYVEDDEMLAALYRIAGR